MNNEKKFGVTAKQLVIIAIGIAVFAVLMAVRAKVEGVWLRASIAGGAFGLMAWSLIQAKSK